jgi:hypothetical protein
MRARTASSVPRMLSLASERLEWSEAGRIECPENFGLKVMSDAQRVENRGELRSAPRSPVQAVGGGGDRPAARDNRE